jgi:hypothetical protein
VFLRRHNRAAGSRSQGPTGLAFLGRVALSIKASHSHEPHSKVKQNKRFLSFPPHFTHQNTLIEIWTL